MPQTAPPTRLITALAILALVYLVVSVFFPVSGFSFTGMDVREQVEENVHIRGLTAENVKYILTNRCTQSYYPARTLTFALDNAIWGIDPMGFKLTNNLIHLANVLLVFWLVLKVLGRGSDLPSPQPSPGGRGGVLDRPSPQPSAGRLGSLAVPPVHQAFGMERWGNLGLATFAAGVFAVHPVVVEPVGWICGREELLLALGALVCVHFHLAARRLAAMGGSRWARLACHGGAALACAVACLSNVVGAIVPFLVAAVDILIEERPDWRWVGWGTAPLWAVAVVAVAAKKLTPDIGVRVLTEPEVLSLVRLRLILGVYWLNLRTLLWPDRLAAYYGQELPGTFLDLRIVLGAVAVAITCGLLWAVRRRKLALLGPAWFLLALAPASQVVPHHIYRADRFLYLPLIGVVVTAAVALRPLVTRGKPAAVAIGVAAVAYLAVITSLSTDQHQIWRDDISLWSRSADAVPRNSTIQSMLADSLAQSGRFEEAIRHYEEALRQNSQNITALNNFAALLSTCSEDRLRDFPRAVRLAEEGCRLVRWDDPDLPGTLAAAYSGLAAHLAEQNQFAPAIEHYQRAIKTDPRNRATLLKLARLLATCPEESLRDPNQAVRLAEEACRMRDPEPQVLSVLASTYAAAGRFREALATVERALGKSEADGSVEQTEGLLRLRVLYRGQAPPGSF